MTKQECVAKACQIIRKRVRFDGVSIVLPATSPPGNDALSLREVTRRYVETWIVPLLDSIESGDMSRIRKYYEHEQGHEMDKPYK